MDLQYTFPAVLTLHERKWGKGLLHAGPRLFKQLSTWTWRTIRKHTLRCQAALNSFCEHNMIAWTRC